MNLPQPPEGILDPQQPWHLPMPKSPGLWGTLKARLTGRPNEYGDYSSYVNITEADADRLIANMKKDPRGYPQLDQTTGTPSQWMERQRIYQEWLVEEYLEKPFREEVNEKIDAKTSEVLDRVFPEAQEEIQQAETREEVSDILEDKIDILEDIQEKIAPPPTENKIPDPWEGSETVPKPKKKPTRRKLKRPKNTVKKKKKPKTPTRRKKIPEAPPLTRRQRFGRMIGGGLKKTGSYIGKSLLSGGSSGGGGGGAEGEGPSLLALGSWLGKKVNKAFQDAKEQKERALEAKSNGAEIPPEVLEPGYFIKKSIGYQFGGRAFDTTFGTFIENMPSKQSKSKAGFGDQFDYGDSDPKKKKKRNDIRDLATGFRKVSFALGAINRQITNQTQSLSQLVNASERNADLLEGILTSITKMVGVEIDSGNDEAVAQQASAGDVNIPSIDLSGLLGKSEGGLDWFDLLFAADDVRDIKNKMKGGGQKTTTRRGGPKVTGDVPKRNRFKLPSLGKFGRRLKFSEGVASVGTAVPALIGEAGPEMLIRGARKKFAEGGVLQGTGSNILATGLGATGDLMKKVQPFANVMEMPFKVIGAQISGALASIVAAAGPFSGVIAKMFSPLLGGLATLFGLNQGAFAAELNSAAMTEDQGAKEISRFFAKFFKLFGFGGGGEDVVSGDEDQDETFTGGEGDWKPLLEIIRKAEGSWESISGQQPIKGLTGWTIQEVANKAPSYAGAYQLDPNSVIGWAKDVGLTPNDKFTPENQNKIAVGLIEGRAQGKQWQKKEISDQKFGNNLASIWAGLPVLSAINGKQRGSSYYAGVSWNKANVSAEEVEESFKKIKGETKASRGVVKSSSFLNQVQGVFEMTGPDTGYKVPVNLTGGQPVIGHGLEWLIKLSNKFIILPGINKEYNVYQNPAKAFNRYEQIGQQSGIQVAGLIDVMDKLIFGSTKKGPSNIRYQSGPRDAIEAIGGKYYAPYAPDSSFKPVREASLPEANVIPLPIPKDTVSGTSVAMVQTITPVIQQVPVYIKGDTQYINVPANPLVAAREKARLSHYTSIT